MTGQDLAIIIGAFAGGLGGLAAFSWTIVRMARGISQINRAVNHQAPGAPTLVERVARMESAQGAHNDRQLTNEMMASRRHAENAAALDKQREELTAALDALSKDVRSLAARVSRQENAKPGATPRRRGAAKETP